MPVSRLGPLPGHKKVEIRDENHCSEPFNFPGLLVSAVKYQIA